MQRHTILCNPYSSHPKVHGPSIIAAEVLDVLRLFLDLRMLQNKAEVSRGFVFALKVFAIVDIYIVKLDKTDEVTG